MTGPRAIRTTSPAFRAAVAELAPSVRLLDEPGAVEVVDGRGAWWERAAKIDRAAGIVIDEPDPAPAAAHADVASLPFPVVVLRRRLRPDVVADAELDAPRHVTVDAWGGRSGAAALLRDAVGWARVLAGGRLRLVARAEAPAATTLALAGPAGVGASVLRAVGGGVGGMLVATALDARRTEVRVDSARRIVEVAFDDVDGRVIRAPRRESAERLALRRILAAIDAGTDPGDRVELAADDAIAVPGE
ncbi:hypothetical protein [Microbacterium sp. XT11]|uniref:hypothetical protein n=1 Tax=Microbacterium sp. XT11 TaxID=367477 RepID=UPI000742DB88|nr:hypothetical protein [Microbacterium sp. XT11]ALX66617.1 Rhs family protein [Microbacterium sp. XT11]